MHQNSESGIKKKRPSRHELLSFVREHNKGIHGRALCAAFEEQGYDRILILREVHAALDKGDLYVGSDFEFIARDNQNKQ